jgi:hypothetical protein
MASQGMILQVAVILIHLGYLQPVKSIANITMVVMQ